MRMRRRVARALAAVALTTAASLALSGCVSLLPRLPAPSSTPTSGAPDPQTTPAADLTTLLPTDDEVGGWFSEPEDRRVVILIGATCAGPYNANDEPSDSPLVGRWYTDDNSDRVMSVAVRFCPRPAGAVFGQIRLDSTGSGYDKWSGPKGIMLGDYGDEEFGVRWTQKDTDDASGKDYNTQLFVACGRYYFEANAVSGTAYFNERTLEAQLEPSIQRLDAAGGCEG